MGSLPSPSLSRIHAMFVNINAAILLFLVNFTATPSLQSQVHIDVTMDDLESSPVLDMDMSDPLVVVDYVQNIYNFYRGIQESSCVENYMKYQQDIDELMRAVLIEWIVDVHNNFQLIEETLFLTVNIIDRFLARQQVSRKNLQLVGMTALFLACKYEELSNPSVEDLIYICDGAYTRVEILEMEKLILQTIQYTMSVPTPCVFMRRFLKTAQSDKKVEKLSSFFIELCLVEYQMLKFEPSLLAAAAIYTAQSALKGYRHWTRTSELHTNYSEAQLVECSRMMVKLHAKTGSKRITSFHEKYNTAESGFTSKTEPARFL